jgi:hypothetical protein
MSGDVDWETESTRTIHPRGLREVRELLVVADRAGQALESGDAAALLATIILFGRLAEDLDVLIDPDDVSGPRLRDVVTGVDERLRVVRAEFDAQPLPRPAEEPRFPAQVCPRFARGGEAGECGFERRGFSWQCRDLTACGVFVHPGQNGYGELTAYYAAATSSQGAPIERKDQ